MLNNGKGAEETRASNNSNFSIGGLNHNTSFNNDTTNATLMT